jgi:hypothetical protein
LWKQKVHKEGSLILRLVIISVLRKQNVHMKRCVIVRRDCGGKVNNLCGDIIGHCENRNFICRESYYLGGDNIGIVRTGIFYGGKFIIVGGDNIVIVRTDISYGGKLNILGGDNIGIVRTEISYGR